MKYQDKEYKVVGSSKRSKMKFCSDHCDLNSDDKFCGHICELYSGYVYKIVKEENKK